MIRVIAASKETRPENNVIVFLLHVDFSRSFSFTLSPFDRGAFWEM